MIESMGSYFFPQSSKTIRWHDTIDTLQLELTKDSHLGLTPQHTFFIKVINFVFIFLYANSCLSKQAWEEIKRKNPITRITLSCLLSST